MNGQGEKNQRGIALVIVLWGVTLLSLLAASFAQSTGLAARRSLHEIEAAQARAGLDEAIAAAVVALRLPIRPWRGDGTAHRLRLAGGEAIIQVTAESGRIDLNHATQPILQTLFRQAAGEAGDHLAAEVAARTTQRPLLSVAELAGLPGMDSTLYSRLAERATVHNPSGRVDWRLADKATLSLLLGADQVATLVAAREQSQYSFDPATAELLTRAGVDTTAEIGPGGAKMMSLGITLNMANGASSSAEILLQLVPAGPLPFHVVEWRAP
jgi:general secretion pathway protein K